MKTKTIFSAIVLFFLLSCGLQAQNENDYLYIKRSSLKKTSYPYWVETVDKNGNRLYAKNSEYNIGHILIKSSGNKITELYKIMLKIDEAIIIVSLEPYEWGVLMLAATKPYANIMYKNLMSADTSKNTPLSKAATEKYFKTNYNGRAEYLDLDDMSILTGEDITRVFKDTSAAKVKIID